MKKKSIPSVLPGHRYALFLFRGNTAENTAGRYGPELGQRAGKRGSSESGSQRISALLFRFEKYGEIDFVIEDQSRVSLIECKSGKDFRKHPALDKVGNVSNWTFASKIVLCEGNLKREQEILYLPWYLVFLMKKEPEPSLIVHFNLDDLQVPDK